MWILAIETTGPVASVALINENCEIKEKLGEKGYNHLTSLVPMTKLLLEENGLTPEDLTGVAASVGPGSFTGIRIGVSTARAFGQSLGIPCLRIPTLQTFLYNSGIAKEEQRKLLCPILDARRDQLYGAVFYKGETVVEENAYSLNEYLNIIANLEVDGLKVAGTSGAFFYGDGISRYSDAITLWGKDQKTQIYFAEEEEKYQRASSGAIIAKQQWDEGKQLSYNDLLPEYMRLAEADRKLKDGTLHV